MKYNKTTEEDSLYRDLEKQSVADLLSQINAEDQKVSLAVSSALSQIEAATSQIVHGLKSGGRLFYLGAGTSGRLGVLDASECPPTFGVSPDLVIGLIAGGDRALRHAVENAEDHPEQGWLDLQNSGINTSDFVLGIAASGSTPYVVQAVKQCRAHGIRTGGLSCNANSPLSLAVDYPIEVIVGPEFITGSSRMKAGSAQKMVLNMISTAAMIQLGRIQGNKMVDMKMTNSKLVERGTRILASELNIDATAAAALLHEHQSVRAAIEHYKKG